MMDIKTESMPSYKIAYMRRVGPYGAGNIRTMEALKSWARSNRLLDDESIVLGIAQDDPETAKPENCRYDACLVISGDTCVQGDSVSYGTVIGGNYAVIMIDHTAEAVQKAWSEIFTELPRQGYTIDFTRPVIERFKAKAVENHQCEICVPLQ